AGNRNGISLEDAVITTTGAFAAGVHFTGADNHALMSSGTVSTSGQNAARLAARGAGNPLSNHGTVTTGGAGSHGLRALGAGAALRHFGTIATTGPVASGLAIELGNGGSVQSSGSVETAGEQSHGILAQGNDHLVTLFGTVTTHGLGAGGIRRE